MLLPHVISFNHSNSFNNDVLYADTSFIWESYGTQSTSKQIECHNFTTKVVQGNSIFVVSPIVEHELRNVALKELLRNEAPKLGLRPHQRKQIIANTPGIMAQAHSHVDQIMEILKNDPNFVILERDATQEQASRISSKYNLDINDSIIIATMLHEQINSIVTLDGDYIAVNDQNLKIYTDHQNYIKLLNEYPNKIANSAINTISNTPNASNNTSNESAS
ncbi:type II toxin-antitoxin system VapC family toxin [Geobacillus thermodenitrificans subsp. calidus]